MPASFYLYSTFLLQLSNLQKRLYVYMKRGGSCKSSISLQASATKCTISLQHLSTSTHLSPKTSYCPYEKWQILQKHNLFPSLLMSQQEDMQFSCNAFLLQHTYLHENLVAYEMSQLLQDYYLCSYQNCLINIFFAKMLCSNSHIFL